MPVKHRRSRCVFCQLGDGLFLPRPKSGLLRFPLPAREVPVLSNTHAHAGMVHHTRTVRVLESQGHPLGGNVMVTRMSLFSVSYRMRHHG
jgi:hypothetical protein